MRHVCMLGRHRATCHLAPFDDPSVEIWTIGAMQDHAPRVTRYYEIHSRDELAAWAAWDPRGPKYLTWLREKDDTPIYMIEPGPDVPGSLLYPTEAAIGQFGWYFTTSIGWMFAHALMEDVRHISVYGVELQHDTEYGPELPGATYFVGLARGMGVQVDIAPESRFCKTPRLYGSNRPTPDAHLFGKTRICGLSGEPTKELLDDLAKRAAWAQAQYALQQG